MTCIFLQIRCAPGKTYEVADAILLKEIHSEMYSTSGDFDLLLKIYVPEDADVGRFINDTISPIPGIERTLTTLTFSAF
jgi:DNA-binding Lrp family transcriptional regulator